MNSLKKGDELIDFKPCCCGTVVTISRRKSDEELSMQRVSVHLARLYYRKWKEDGFVEKG